MSREGQDGMVMKLEGRLADAWVNELARIVEPTMDRGLPIVIDLDGLAFIDPRGVALLREATNRGACLRGGSTFIAALMAEDPNDDLE